MGEATFALALGPFLERPQELGKVRAQFLGPREEKKVDNTLGLSPGLEKS